MTTSRLFGVLLAVLTVTMAVAMARTRHAGPPPGFRDHAVTGVVTAAPADGRVMVAHEEIANFMPAMTMPFALTPGERMPVLQPGDRVRFTLRVDDEAAWATGFEVVGFDSAVASALSGGRGVQPTRLRVGDAVPDVSLVTQAGTPFSGRDLRGHATAVTFIFTRCPVPEFCPLMVKRFQEVQRAITRDPALGQARLLAVSLDPTFDSPAVLDAYARAMQADPARWQFVTGAPADVQRLTKAFAIHVERNGVLLDHTLATAVLGPDGRVRAIWRGNGWKADEVVAALRAATDHRAEPGA
jgi:protein SCO1